MENLSIFFRHFGVNAAAENKQFKVIFNRVHDPLLGGLAGGENITALATTEDVRGIEVDETILINGGSFTIREKHVEQDGKFTKLILEEIPINNLTNAATIYSYSQQVNY